MKIPVIYHKDYIFYFEHLYPATFIHCDCFRWNKTVKESMLNDLHNLIKLHRNDIFAVIEPSNVKLQKFASLMGFHRFKDFVGTDGNLYHVFVRRI